MSQVYLVSSNNLTVQKIAWFARVSTTPIDKSMMDVLSRWSDKTEREKDEKLCKHLYTAGHWSVFEHVSLTYLLECSRACSLQLARHRHISRTEMSQRYVKFDKVQSYELPVLTSVQEDTLISCLSNAFKDYELLLNMGVSPEEARAVLPEATTTRMFITLNLRTLLELTQKRACDPRAQREIRELVQEMWNDIPSEIKEIFRPELKWLDDANE